MNEYYWVIPEYNSEGRICGFHSPEWVFTPEYGEFEFSVPYKEETGTDGETVIEEKERTETRTVITGYAKELADTDENKTTVKVKAEEWERFNLTAGRNHEIKKGYIVYNETLEPCLPDIAVLEEQEEIERGLLKELLIEKRREIYELGASKINN